MVTEKRCPDCGVVKPLDQFPRNRGSALGRHAYCKSCHNARNRITVQSLHGNSRHYHLMQKYGISKGQVVTLIENQSGLCAVCRTAPATQVDHDHSTGKIRGILCLHCNAGMGAFEDDPSIILRAIEYLERSDGTRQPD